MVVMKSSYRDRILTEGLRVVAEQGFTKASVRDIVAAAGVPQGSFTHHFTSKEAFGIELLERYYRNTKIGMDATLHNDARPPLERLKAYLEHIKGHLQTVDMRNGCLFGNFIAESNLSDPIRTHLNEILAKVRASFAYCLRAAVVAEEVPARLDCDETAGYIVSSLQGAILISKAQRSVAPFEAFQRLLFYGILRMDVAA